MNTPHVAELQVCDVCFLIDGDATPKPCLYCSICKSWMCELCRGDYQRRAKAAIAKKIAEGKAAIAQAFK